MITSRVFKVNRKKLIYLIISCLFQISAANAEESIKVQFNQTLISLSKDKNGSLSGTGLFAPECVINNADYFLHLYPTVASGPVALGWGAGENTELGVSHAQRRLTSGDIKESHSASGIYLTQTFPSDGTSFELNISLNSFWSRNNRNSDIPGSDQGESASIGVTAIKAFAPGLSIFVSLSEEQLSHKNEGVQHFDRIRNLILPGIRLDI